RERRRRGLADRGRDRLHAGLLLRRSDRHAAPPDGTGPHAGLTAAAAPPVPAPPPGRGAPLATARYSVHARGATAHGSLTLPQRCACCMAAQGPVRVPCARSVRIGAP